MRVMKNEEVIEILKEMLEEEFSAKRVYALIAAIKSLGGSVEYRGFTDVGNT